VPAAGAPTPGNPKGNYTNLNQGLFNNTIMLGTGGNPVVLYQVADTFQMVLEGNFSQAPTQTNVAAAMNPDGSTFWSSDNGNVSVSTGGLLTGVNANSCSTISATFT